MEVSECRYRGRVIGWLKVGPDGFLSYESQAVFDRKVAEYISANYEAYWD